MSLYNKLFSEELMHEFIIVIARNFIGHWRLIEFFFFSKQGFTWIFHCQATFTIIILGSCILIYWVWSNKFSGTMPQTIMVFKLSLLSPGQFYFWLQWFILITLFYLFDRQLMVGVSSLVSGQLRVKSTWQSDYTFLILWSLNYVKIHYLSVKVTAVEMMVQCGQVIMNSMLKPVNQLLLGCGIALHYEDRSVSILLKKTQPKLWRSIWWVQCPFHEGNTHDCFHQLFVIWVESQ